MLKKSIKIKKILVIFLSYLLATQSLLADGGDSFSKKTPTSSGEVTERVAEKDISLYLSTNAKIYFAQYLLSDKKNWGIAYEILRDVVRNDDSLSEVVIEKIDQAATIINRYQFKKFVNNVMAIQYQQRPYVKAFMLLSEALMDSRIDINVPNDSEILFVENLIKNYFYPGHPERIKIIYPSVEDYAFTDWSLTDENIKKSRTAPSNERDGIINQLTEVAAGSNAPGMSNGTPGFPQIPGGIPQMPINRKDGQKIPMSSGAILFPPDNDIPRIPMRAYVTLKPNVNEGPEMLDIDDIKNIELLVDGGIEMVENIAELQQNYKKLKNRVSNEYLNEAMLMQIIADPGSVMLDPQLQAFAKKVKIEVNMGKVDAPSTQEVDDLQNLLEEKIVEIDENSNNYVINLSKLYGLSRNGTFSNLELKYKLEKGSGARATLFLVSSVAGEDLLFLRLLANASVTAGPIFNKVSTASSLSSSWFNKNLIDKLIRSGAKMKIASDQGGRILRPGYSTISGVVTAPQATQKLSTIGKLYVGFTERLESIKSPIEKISNSEIAKKMATKLDTITHGKLKQMIENGTMLYLLVGLNVVAEATVGTMEYVSAKTVQDKREIRDETLANIGGNLLLAAPYVGVAVGLIDLSHLIFGLPVEGADLFWLTRSLAQRAALIGSGYNPTTLQLQEYEVALRVPRSNIALDKFTKNITSIEQGVTNLQAMSNEMQNISGSYLTLLYKGHRNLSRRVVDRSMYDFGAQIEFYMEKFEDNTTTFTKNESIISAQTIGLFKEVQ